MKYDLITILGPTASGKTSIASNLAKDFNGEIISADSRQVYIGMDIGTGKDLFEFQKNNIIYHLIDVIEPFEEYNLFRFTKDFQTAFEEIKNKSKIPILVGGTGLYISAILQSYNLPKLVDDQVEELNKLTLSQLKDILIKLKPKLHNVTDLIDKKRIIKAILVERSRGMVNNNFLKFNSLNIGIKTEREESKRRINDRLNQRLKNGMIEEIEELIVKGVSKERLNNFGLEYKYVVQFVEGKLNYNDMFQKLNSAIINFSKRQMTWFRKMQREGIEITWYSPESYTDIKNFVIDRLGFEK